MACNVDKFGGTRIGDQGRQNSFIVAVGASAYAGARLDARLTDSRGDLPEINVHTLLVHGAAEPVLP